MNGGFFTAEETRLLSQPKRMTGCGACKLHRTCKTPRMEPTGKGGKKILIIAEAPGETEDTKGVQLVGKAGQLLRQSLRRLGIDLDEDCRKTNALSCRPQDSDGDNRAPTLHEIECCSPRVWREIETFQPKLIILLGTAAVTSFLQGRFKKDIGGINKWRGWTIPDRDVKAWVCPTFHPSYVLRSEKQPVQPVIKRVWETDLENAIEMLRVDYPNYGGEESGVEILSEETHIMSKLQNILEFEIPFAFDYETTGLKPHMKGHEIYSCSIATDPNRAFAFLMPPEGSVRSLFRRILMERKIKKVAQNIKFEDNWTNVALPGVVEGWLWDTMIATHILDNREDITGLKFQCYVQFGLMDYSSHIEAFLKGDGKHGGNSFNRIKEAPRQDILKYNGVDSMVELRLALKQMEILKHPGLKYFK